MESLESPRDLNKHINAIINSRVEYFKVPLQQNRSTQWFDADEIKETLKHPMQFKSSRVFNEVCRFP